MGVKVKERFPGEWWVLIYHGGRRKAKKIGRDESMAREVAKRLEAKLALGEISMESERAAPKMKEYAEKWLETYVKVLRRESTYDRYKSILKKYVYPSPIGKVPIDKIKRGDVRDLLLAVHGRGLSKASVSLLRDVVNGPLTHALDAELISVNPVTGLVKALQIERDKREHLDPFTHEEVNLFLTKCAAIYPEHYPFFLCAFRTGMRLGELLALRWGDVDFNGKFIQVARSYKRGRMTATKTGKVRRVDVSEQLFSTLKAFHITRKEEGLKMGRGDAPELIFHRAGMPMEQNHIRRIFKRILDKAGLRKIRVHDIRHTYASLLLSDGVSLVYVKEQLGHSSIQMTVDIYGHWIPSSNRAMVNRLDNATASSPHPGGIEKEEGEQGVEVVPLSKTWCRRGDSNPYVATHTRP